MNSPTAQKLHVRSFRCVKFIVIPEDFNRLNQREIAFANRTFESPSQTALHFDRNDTPHINCGCCYLIIFLGKAFAGTPSAVQLLYNVTPWRRVFYALVLCTHERLVSCHRKDIVPHVTSSGNRRLHCTAAADTSGIMRVSSSGAHDSFASAFESPTNQTHSSRMLVGVGGGVGMVMKCAAFDGGARQKHFDAMRMWVNGFGEIAFSQLGAWVRNAKSIDMYVYVNNAAQMAVYKTHSLSSSLSQPPTKRQLLAHLGTHAGKNSCASRVSRDSHNSLAHVFCRLPQHIHKCMSTYSMQLHTTHTHTHFFHGTWGFFNDVCVHVGCMECIKCRRYSSNSSSTFTYTICTSRVMVCSHCDRKLKGVCHSECPKWSFLYLGMSSLDCPWLQSRKLY